MSKLSPFEQEYLALLKALLREPSQPWNQVSMPRFNEFFATETEALVAWELYCLARYGEVRPFPKSQSQPIIDDPIKRADATKSYTESS